MSYCRFSSDNWKSDVYAWEDCDGGCRIAVAGNRVVGEAPPLPSFDAPNFVEAYNAQMEWLKAAERVPIGGPRDNALIATDTEAEMYDELRKLRSEGYHVPDFVFDEEEHTP